MKYAVVDLENGRRGCGFWPRTGGWLLGDGLSNMTVCVHVPKCMDKDNVRSAEGL